MAINATKGIESDKKINEMKTEINSLKEEVNALLEAKKYFLGQIEIREILLKEKEEEIRKICYSRRWKYTSKIANIVHKIKRKKG